MNKKPVIMSQNEPLWIAVVSERLEQWQRLLTTQDRSDIHWVFLDDPDFFARAKRCTVMWGDTPVAAQWLPKLPNIRWFHTFYSGVDTLLPVRGALPTDLIVTNSRDIAGPHIAEYALGQVLAHTRHWATFYEAQKQRQWQPQDYVTIAEAKALILGTGAIGATVAQRLAPWFVQVDGLSRSGQPKPGFTQVLTWGDAALDLRAYRVIINTLPSTPDTVERLDRAFFTATAGNMLFINVGRGSAVVESDLLAALDDAPARHAVLDVFRTEPLPAEHPFWRHPQVTVTPHVAAQSQPQWVLPIVLDNLQRYQAGHALRNQVDLAAGY
ncbi:D-2-hydroxyacid dehydrogenase [Salinispirillum marinum]|uniref:D-2-hydroxyacid dehydrogenase n=2 Tax=Saccharospirillaceae TaxID=255527 RepID=A0ABV8BHS3_9GAMM